MKLKGEDKMILKKLKIKTWVGDPTNCYVIFDENSKEIFSRSFDVENIEESHFFDGIVSRKKQIVPKIMNYLDSK